jgi:DNA/RNA-binding domain of Phe-tRNA-synthetase-like protein
VHFCHSPELWREYPALVPGVLSVDGIASDADVGARLEPFLARAEARLAAGPESELPEIQAWRRAFSRMGLKPTQYRCASEALLRRFRKDGVLPRIHPLIDLCNAVSLAFAIPVAVFDRARITGALEVRHAEGSELYETFSGETEQPDPGEVIFADDAARVHARRWTNRQSGTSTVRAGTASALIVAEALHESARTDVERLVAALAEELEAAWSARPRSAILTRASPHFEV